jgi:hypothetical protein
MANTFLRESEEQTQLDRLHFAVGVLVLSGGVYLGAFALQFLFLR